MKKSPKKMHLVVIIPFFLLFTLILSSAAFADPPVPPGGAGGTTNTDPVRNGGSGAPIDGGLGILLALGAGYGGFKFFKANRKEKET